MRNTVENKCPVCLGANGGKCSSLPVDRDGFGFDCESCGRYEISGSAFVTYFEHGKAILSDLQRAVLSHKLSTSYHNGGKPLVTMEWMESFLENPKLPSQKEQAKNIIRLIGDDVRSTGAGHHIRNEVDISRVGAFDKLMFEKLIIELKEKGLIRQLEVDTTYAVNTMVFQGSYNSWGLSLEGWDRYDAELKGQFSGTYGFIAMKFGDEVLDKLVDQVIKSSILKELGFDLVDLRDVSRAGVIDNIMREQIRDAAFVLVDLTHDNSGAYWEAGYAEGLGKPVIYLCEKLKFDEAKTHFDTNHCTTVLWDKDDPETLTKSLVATLRRSLNLFA